MEINPWESLQPAFVESNVATRQPLRRVEKPEFFADTVPAALGYQYLPLFDVVRNAVKYGTETQKGYNPLDDVEGYETHKHQLINAVSPDHMRDLKMQLDENKRRRQVLADSSFWANLGAGVFDPINLVALPFGGVAATAGRQFLRTGAGVGVTQAGLEAARAPFDPLATRGEIATNIGSAFVIGGAIGTLFSIPARRRGAAIIKTEDEVTQFVNEIGDITPDQLSKINNSEYRTFKDRKQNELNNFEKIFPKERDLLESKLQKAKEKANALFIKASNLRKQYNKTKTAALETQYKKANDEYKAANNQVKILESSTAQKRVDVEKVKEEQVFRRIEEMQKLRELTINPQGKVKDFQPEDSIIVYSPDGKPSIATVVKVSKSGGIIVRDADGTEKILELSDASQVTPYDPNFKIETVKGTPILKNLDDTALAAILKTLDRKIKAQTKSGKINYAMIRERNAIRIEQKRRAGEEVIEPAKPILSGDPSLLAKPFDFVDNWFTDSWFYKGIPTGFKRVLQDAKVPQTVKSMMVRLAGDSAMLYKMNLAGFATPKSVYQYAQTRNGEWLQVYMKMLDQFGEHTSKGVTQIGDVVISNIDGSFSKYLKEVNRKYIHREEASTTAEKESIQALEKFYKTWEDRLVEQGIIGSIKSIEMKMDNIKFKIQRKEKTLLDAQIKMIEKAFNPEEARRWISRLRREKINQTDVMKVVRSPFDGELPQGVPDYLIDVINDSNTRIAALQDQLYELEFSMLVAKEEGTLPQNEELMFPRYWNRDEIRARRQQFAAILKEHYKENPYIYERNEAAFEERRIRNISELSDEEIQARFGEEFNMFSITSNFRRVQDGPIGRQGGGALGMFVRYTHKITGDSKQEVYLDSTGIYQYYNELAEAMKNPSKAFKDLDATRSKNTEDYAHRKFVMRNWSFFQTFNDFQDFVLFHELHHNKFNQSTMTVKTQADQLRMENATDRAALAFLKEKLPEIREGQPVYFKRRLDVEDERMLNKRVEDTIDNILGLSDTASNMNAYYGAGKSKHMRHRSLDIPNAKVFEFIQNDPLAVMKAYTSRVAPQYEFSKMFGGKSVDEVLDDIDTDMAGQPIEKINAVRKDFLHLYDRVVGTVLREPHSWDQRTATVLRDFAQLNYLGSAGFSTLPDFAKIMMEHELKDVFKSLFASLSDSRVRMSAMEGKLAGEILEVIIGDTHMRLIDDVTNNPFNEGTYDKYMSKIKWGFYQANLLAPLTNTMKKMDAIVRGHSLIQMSMRVAGSGKKATKFEIEYLARYGIDNAKAKRIRELVDKGIIEQTEGGLYLPNTEKWPVEFDDLKLEFRSSLNSGIMNTILMGTPADKPNIVDGVVYVPYRIARQFGGKEDPKYRGYTRIENGLLGLPFQFYSYTLAAVNKITASYATGQARNRAVALAASMGLAYVGLELKNPDFVMDEMAIEDKIARSFDMSGVAALYSDGLYTAMNTSMALGGPDISMGLIQPKFPQEENTLDAIVGIAGAGPSIGVDAYRSISEMVSGDFGEGAKQGLRTLPLARLWMWKDLMNEASNAFTAKRY